MKKFSKLLCVIMMAIVLVVPFANVNAAKTTKKTTTTTTTASTYAVSNDEKAVTIYVFYSPTCPHCQDLHEFLSELKEDKDYKDKFNVKDYSVAESLNLELLDEVHDYFKYSGNGGVPYYVIGDEPFEGFGDSTKAEIKKTIDDMYGSKNYKDVVNAIINDEVASLSDDANNVIGMVVLGLCVVIIIALIICSSKNKYYEDDENDEDEEETETKVEEVKETKVSEKKIATKKSPAKKGTSKTKNAKK
ncbi:MAG: DsbA family protein [Bacilli bacterium]|nr:DsbA family protein [Bacilli bacterium]